MAISAEARAHLEAIVEIVASHDPREPNQVAEAEHTHQVNWALLVAHTRDPIHRRLRVRGVRRCDQQCAGEADATQGVQAPAE
jgi:hypothetical protein